MTVANTTVKQLFNGNGSTVDFAIPFKFFDTDDVRVVLRDNSVSPSTETLQVEGVDYTLTNISDSLPTNVKMGTAPASTEQLLLIRASAFLQDVDFITGGSFPADTNETALDEVVLKLQEMNEELERTFRVRESDTVSAATLVLPDIVAGGVFKIKDDGSGVEYDTNIGGASKQFSISSNDATKDYAVNKLVGSTNIVLSETNDGATETLVFTLPAVQGLQFKDTSADHNYTVTVSELSANRNILLPLLTGDDEFVFKDHAVTMANKTLTSPVLNTGVSGSAVLDEDNMASDSDTQLATQQSIKAYADTKLPEPTGNGIAVRTAADTAVNRSIAGTADEISVADGDGVSGNPTIGIADDPVLPGTGSVKVPAGTTAQRPGSPINGDFRYNSSTGKFEGYYSGAWSELAGGAGGGDADQIDILNADSETDVSGWDTTGQNATFDNGGTITGGSLTLNTTAANLLSGNTNVFAYIPAANGQNDFFARTTLVPKGWRGRDLGVKYIYKTDSTYTDEDIDLVIKDDTNGTILATLALDKQDVTDDVGAVYTTNFFCPSDCAALVIGFQNTSTTTTIEFYVDRFELTANPFVYKNLVVDQELAFGGLGSTMTSVSAGSLRWGTLSTNETGPISYDDSNGRFTAKAPCRVFVGMFTRITGSTNTSEIHLNGSRIAISAQPVSGYHAETSVSLKMAVGDYIELRTGNALSTAENQYFRMVAEADSEHVITPTQYGQPVDYETDAGQSIPSATETTVNFEDKNHDNDGLVSVGAGWTFTPNHTGWHEVSAYILYDSQSWNAGEVCTLAFRQGTTILKYLDQHEFEAAGTFVAALGNTVKVYLTKGTTYNLSTYQNNASARTLNTDATRNWVNIFPFDASPVLGAIPKADANSCEAYVASTQTDNSGSYVDCVLGTSVRDTGGMVNNVTGEITIPESGWYDLSAQVWMTTNASGSVTSLGSRIYKNGTTGITLDVDNALTNNTSYIQQHSKSVYLSKGDTLKLQFSSTTANNSTLQNGEGATYLSVTKKI